MAKAYLISFPRILFMICQIIPSSTLELNAVRALLVKLQTGKSALKRAFPNISNLYSFGNSLKIVLKFGNYLFYFMYAQMMNIINLWGMDSLQGKGFNG